LRIEDWNSSGVWGLGFGLVQGGRVQMIELKDLTKHFGDVVAVNRLNLAVLKGEIFGFIGPNGAGKTTTLRMMGGVLAPTEGSVIIDGVNIVAEPERAKRKIGFIPDRPFLYEKLTGMEFMKFTADLFDLQKSLFDQKSEQILKQFSLYPWADELIESYSHGMKQRLIISAAILHDPMVIVVDEPMVGLDPAGMKMVKSLFRNLARKGTTIFMSTHTLTVAEDVCDRIGIIHKGNLIATGTTEELRLRARVQEGDLEEVFLILTEGESVP
jgi:ABC-2 type transport system ATP-binding protein